MFCLFIVCMTIIVRQAKSDFSELMICQIFSTDVKKTQGGSQLYGTIVKFCHNS
jgi:hypothetical protein